MFKTGFQAGYDLGYEIGKRRGFHPFNGTSIILPTCLPDEDVITTIRKIEALTPHPYELIVANAGSSEVTMQYLRKRAGAVRHIAAGNGENIVGVLNKAVFAAHGQTLAVLMGVSPNIDQWLADLIAELERDSSMRTIYVCSAPSTQNEGADLTSLSGDEDVRFQLNVCCLLFRKELISDIGLWDENLGTLGESVCEWLSRIPKPNKSLVEASDRFIRPKH